jgi:hypothetical protein
MRDCLILGTGRSGTSMVAGCLRNAGYYMGRDLKPGMPSNPLGYFESVEVNDINEDLLAPVVQSLARDWRPWRRHPRLYRDMHWLAVLPPRTRVPADATIEARIRSAVSHGPFCFKDPRFCYTLDVWRPLIGDVLYVCVFREPGRTAASILRNCREAPYLQPIRMTRAWALRVWERMYANLLDRLATDGDWLFMHYDQVLDGTALPRLAAALGGAVDASFPRESLKRSPNTDAVPRRARMLYRELCARAHHAV